MNTAFKENLYTNLGYVLLESAEDESRAGLIPEHILDNHINALLDHLLGILPLVEDIEGVKSLIVSQVNSVKKEEKYKEEFLKLHSIK